MDKTAELLEELESRRTFSAFLTSRKSDDQDDRLLSSSAGDSLQNIGDNTKKPKKSKENTKTTTHHSTMGRFAEFIQRDRAVYKQRTWLSRIAKQLHQDHFAGEVSIAGSPYPTPITVSSSSAGGGKKKKRHHRRGQASLGRMTPGSTLLSIGESCEAKTATVKPAGSGVDVKAWPAFRQYKSIVATSAATRVPKLKPDTVIIRSKKPLNTALSTGLPPTLANILASSRNMTASPQLKATVDPGKISLDPMFPLHLVRLAVIDGEEQKACSILEDVFGLRHPQTPAPKDSTQQARIKASLLTKPKFWPVLLRIWLRAVDRGMDSLLLMLYSAGIPASPLAPITFSAAKRPPPPSSGPKFYTLAGITSSVSILSSGSGATTAANNTANWLQRNYREWMVDRFPSFLLAAIAFGRTKLVQAMIDGARKTTYALVNSAGWLGFTPLLVATSGRGHLHLTKALLEAGADPIIGISYYYFLLARHKLLLPVSGRTKKKKRTRMPQSVEDKIQWAKEVPLLPIEVAAASQNFELVLLLLGRSLVPMRLGLLVQFDLDIAVRLLKAGALSSETDAFGNTAMHRAAAKGRPDLIALYLHYGCPIDAVNVHGCTALHEAAAFGQKSALRYLIQAGADCSVQNQQGLTALEVARRHGYTSEDLADYFSTKKTANTTARKMQEDMEALIQQVDSYNLRSDLDHLNTNGNVNVVQRGPQRPEPVQQQRKGRFLIEKIINPKQWWS